MLVLCLDKLDCFLLQAQHNLPVDFIEPICINGNEFQPIFCQTFDCRFCIEASSLRLSHADTIQDIAANTLCPKQRCSCIFGIIPVLIHPEEVQFFMEYRANFFLNFCIDCQPEDAVLFRPFITVHGGFSFLSCARDFLAFVFYLQIDRHGDIVCTPCKTGIVGKCLVKSSIQFTASKKPTLDQKFTQIF